MANNLCFTYYQEGRWQEAETCFRQTLTRDPDNVAARNNLGSCIAVSAARTRPAGSGRKQRALRPLTPK